MEIRGVKILCGEKAVEIRLEGENASLDGRPVRVSLLRGERSLDALVVDGRIVRVASAHDGPRVLVWCEGDVFEFFRESDRPRRTADVAGDLIAPMPGRVRRVLVSEGSPVTRGEVVFVLEAMKMEHSLRAPRDGVVRSIGPREGDLVEAGAILAEME
jgi:3-methylcrotonyl-CoA carboxylase alpha subunit